jgi:DNA-binding SARP family transcriptional activator
MLYVSVLGEQAITDGEAGVHMHSSHAVALVAFLAAHAGAPQPRQRIAGMFWPDSTDAQALTNLRRELHHLRQVLGDERSLVVAPRDLCWRDSQTCRVDLRIFEGERQAALTAAAAGDDAGILAHAATAIAQYRGDLLPGAYDDWVLEARSELERQCTDLCDLLCAARARTGDLAGAADTVRRRIQLQPLEEVGYRTLMLLHADLGDRAGAVSTYHHCASVLERELGVIPDPATRQAFQRLMADTDPVGSGRPGLQPDAPRSGLAAARLVGRLRELGQLQDLWRIAAAGHPGLALVSGGAGVGKTRLVAELAEMARLHGAMVASSQCFEGLARGLMVVGQPLLLVLDNMQWCDRETLAFLTFFLGLASGTPVLVAGTVRNDTHGQEPELADWTVRMRAAGLITELSLGPLDAADTARVAEAISGRSLLADDVDLLQATTGGFPLYVIEAVRGGVDPGGTSLPADDLTTVLRNRLD